MPNRSITGVEDIEVVANELGDWAAEQIKVISDYYGPRPAFTEKMKPDEKYQLWQQIEAQGPQGWDGFIRGRMDEGMTTDEAIKEAFDLHTWAVKRTED